MSLYVFGGVVCVDTVCICGVEFFFQYEVVLRCLPWSGGLGGVYKGQLHDGGEERRGALLGGFCKLPIF